MNFILYSDINERSIGHNLGRPEYSYYFVLKAYRPILESLGQVHLVQSTDEVDPLYRQLHEQGEDCLFLSFTRRTRRRGACNARCCAWSPGSSRRFPTWRGTAIRRRTGARSWPAMAQPSPSPSRLPARFAGCWANFPVLALPTPIWEDFAAIRQQGERNPVKSGETLQLKGCVIDSRLLGLSADGLIAPIREETEDEILEVLPETPAEPEPKPVPEPEPEPVPLDWRRRLVISKHYLLLWYRSRQRPGTHTGTPLAVPSPAPAAAAHQRRWKRCRSHCPRPSSRYRQPSPSIRRRCCRTSTSTSRSSWTGGLRLGVQSAGRAQELASPDHRLLLGIPRHQRCHAGAEDDPERPDDLPRRTAHPAFPTVAIRLPGHRPARLSRCRGVRPPVRSRQLLRERLALRACACR